MEQSKSKILVVLTGGTICSTTNEQGERYSDASNVKIIGEFKQGSSSFRERVDFDTIMPTDILSENMTIDNWNVILEAFRSTVDWEQYKGVIVLHGTDTLAYTSSLLSIALAGVPIPVCLVSSQLPLDDQRTNGHVNFRASVELIMNHIAPNVYAVYRNSNGIIYVHYGAHLLQCANYSEDFYSKDAMEIADPENACLEGTPFETEELYLNRLEPLTACVLRIMPYVGIDYNAYNLTGMKAVVHGTYHSETVCVERKGRQGKYSNASILQFMDACKEKELQLFLTPCSPDAYKYESTGDILDRGASYIYGMTDEMAYVKTLVGCALQLKGEDLMAFVNKSINHEIIYG